MGTLKTLYAFLRTLFREKWIVYGARYLGTPLIEAGSAQGEERGHCSEHATTQLRPCVVLDGVQHILPHIAYSLVNASAASNVQAPQSFVPPRSFADRIHSPL